MLWIFIAVPQQYCAIASFRCRLSLDIIILVAKDRKLPCDSKYLLTSSCAGTSKFTQSEKMMNKFI